MRVQRYVITVLIGALLAAPAGAQAVEKAASKAHHELQEAGKGIKQGAKEAGGEIHHELKKAGNGTKTALRHATGIHKIGGDVGKAARAVSRGEKKVARKAKHGLKRSKAAVHGELTKAGKDAKGEIKPDRS
jgi:hypothetical protein